MARIGILTGGGDCPGLNAVIRAVVRKGVNTHGYEIFGLLNGWRGLMDGRYEKLDVSTTSGILPRGGTILGTSRTNLYAEERGPERARQSIARLGLDGLVAIGGDDTLGVANRLVEDGIIPVVGVPKTIDNDLGATDFTFGFQTAVQICTDAIDRLHTTAESHHRIIVVEVMGRHAGWIACHSGIAGGADAILVPERPFDLQEVAEMVERRRARGRTFSIVVAAEGAAPKGGAIVAGTEVDAFGHPRLGGIAVMLERELQERTGYETRMTILGHVQRGGTPIAYDRVLATRFGVAAIDAIADGESGKMVALHGLDIDIVPLVDALGRSKTLDPELYETAEVFFG